jgi:glutathione S-transferase
MSELKLVVGDKNLSSWSMRAYLAGKLSGLPIEEVVILLDQPDTATRIATHAPSGKVPVLHDGAIRVWDSLAIVEYLAEKVPALWPADAAARAMARSACAEMHSGFADMRPVMRMNVAARRPIPEAEVPPAVLPHTTRVQALWRECRGAHGRGGPFLFGAFSVADCFFAPVVTRFVTYGTRLEADTRAYVDAMLAHPLVAAWIAEAEAEAKQTGSATSDH